MADGKRRYKSDRKDHKVSVKLSENDMDILKAALNRTGMTASAYIRELIRTGGNIDTSYPEDRAKAEYQQGQVGKGNVHERNNSS